MKPNSAGILMYRIRSGKTEFLLVHPGGPFYRNKDLGTWSIPKGEYEEGEDPKLAALREFEEELGRAPTGDLTELSPIRQKAGKLVRAWALEGDLNCEDIRSNTFSMEWPPRSGKFRDFPEVDRAEWLSIEQAREKINPAQLALLEEIIELIKKKK